MDFENLVTKVVVVTYGERWPLLKKTLDSIMKHKRIDEVIIVQNGLEYDLQSKISSFPKLKLIINEKNEGSAGGFYVGLKYLKNKSEHNFNVLIMDDDNIIDDNAFKALNCAEHLYSYENKHIWSLFRPEVQSDLAFSEEFEKTIDSIFNTINGFTLLHVLFKNYKMIPRKYAEVNRLITAPYSGLIFPVKLLDEVGLPNKDFYLYSDDIDFTLRITRNGYQIYQYKEAKSYDQGIAWQEINSIKKTNRGAFFTTDEIYRPLYTYRNELYISYIELKSNNLIFWMNYYFLQLWMFIDYMPKNINGIKKYLLLKKAMRQGVKGVLGKAQWIEKTRREGK